MRHAFSGLAILFAVATPAAAADFKLGFPIDCQLGRSCEIQNYVDRDPAAGAVRDYRGGALTYDAHNGVDIRLPDLAAQKRGVKVLAAADGKVLRVRDGVPDISVKAAGQASAVANTECGNGLVIGHEGGWETQYCHMARGSLVVKPGDPVKAGQPLGLVGLSGNTEYPHLHVTLRRNGQMVDPFDVEGAGSVWRTTPPYKVGAVLNTGFATGQVSMASIEAGPGSAPTDAAEALLIYGRAIDLRAGDQQELTLKGPDGKVLATNKAAPLPRNQAQNMMFIGRKRPATGWPKGTYVGEYQVWRGGAAVLRQQFRTAL